MSKRAFWNERYSGQELVWGAEPNQFVEQELSGVEPGAVLDLACGEGRNAIWLAAAGWRVTAVDFSDVAIARGRELARARGVEVAFIEADVTEWQPQPRAVDAVIVSYLQVPSADRRRVWALVAAALVPGGRLFAVGHALRNRTEGSGGPQDPAVLWDPPELASELEQAGIEVVSTEERTRPAAETERDAIDVVLRGRLPGALRL